jgi:hypothetical protein
MICSRLPFLWNPSTSGSFPKISYASSVNGPYLLSSLKLFASWAIPQDAIARSVRCEGYSKKSAPPLLPATILGAGPPLGAQNKSFSFNPQRECRLADEARRPIGRARLTGGPRGLPDA